MMRDEELTRLVLTVPKPRPLTIMARKFALEVSVTPWMNVEMRRM